MWDDRRLLAAIAALPPEAFVEGPPDGGDLLWRRAAKQARDELSGAGPSRDDRPIAPVIPLPLAFPVD
jgi:hypothetical protein